MRFPALLLVAFLSVYGLSAQDAPLALVNANVIDGTGAAPFSAAVIVENGRVAALQRAAPDIPEGARVIDLGGRYLLPGFIDAHVHIGSVEQAGRALRSGVTTARSMGGAHFTDVGLRELIESGVVEGPEMLAAGYHIRPEVFSAFFLDEPELGDLFEGPGSPADYRRLANANLGRGVDFLKVVATDRAGLPATDPRKQIMTREELAAVVEEAAKRGIPVAAHAHGDAGGRAAVEAGVRSIEHGTYLSRATLELMKEKGTYLVPTVAVVRDLTQAGGDYDNPVLRIRGRHMLPRVQQTVRQARDIGVRIVASTDTGYGPESLVRMPHDILELTRCGLTPMEAIQAASQTAAQLLRIEGRTGTIAEGKEADLIVVESNPLEDIVALQDVLLVTSDGRLALDRVTRTQPAAPSGH